MGCRSLKEADALINNMEDAGFRWFLHASTLLLSFLKFVVVVVQSQYRDLRMSFKKCSCSERLLFHHGPTQPGLQYEPKTG